MARLTSLPPLVAALPRSISSLPPFKITNRFYFSKEWRGLMQRLKAQRGKRCEECGASGILHGDHIREIKDGGAPLDPSNVRLLCVPCHNRKTHLAKQSRKAM